MISWVPFLVEERGSSRHSVLPWDCSRISPLASSLHFSLEAPLQVHRMTLLRMPPLPWSFRHLPLWMNSLLLNCQFSAGSEPLQVQITTCARLDELLPRSSRHLLPKPTTCGGLLVVVGEGLGDGLADTADVKLSAAVNGSLVVLVVGRFTVTDTWHVPSAAVAGSGVRASVSGVIPVSPPLTCGEVALASEQVNV